MRVDFSPGTMTSRTFYQLLTAVVVPRPIAWVSSTSESGVDNLAPHSFFTVACVSPPVIQFTSVGRKDSLRNIERTRGFVVNLACEQLREQINVTSTNFPPNVDEFAAAGLAKEPSRLVTPPRVAQSPVALECELHSTVCLGDSTVVFGRVVHAAVDERVLVAGHPAIDRLRPVARLGRDEWATVGAVMDMPRPVYQADNDRQDIDPTRYR